MSPRPTKKVHLLMVRWAFGVPKKRAACTTTMQPRMVEDPKYVTCQRCKETRYYERLVSQ